MMTPPRVDYGDRWHGLLMTRQGLLRDRRQCTTARTPGLAQQCPAREAEAVSRLRVAGAVIVGETNMPPYAVDIQSAKIKDSLDQLRP